MTNPVPNFPGKPAQTGSKPAEPWQNAICPLLTAGEVARMGPPSSIVQLGPDKQKQGASAQACIGPKCMWFAQLKAANGEVLSGCAPVHALQAQLELNQMVAEFIMAAKAGAAAEAAAAEPKTPENVTETLPAPLPAADAVPTP